MTSRFSGAIRRWLLATLLLTALTSMPLGAQYREWRDTTLRPLRPIYGVPDSEFQTGIWQYFYGHYYDLVRGRDSVLRPIEELWPWMHDSLGISTIVYSGNDGHYFDSLVDGSTRPANGRVVPTMIPYLQRITTAQGATFFPFDSSTMRAMVPVGWRGGESRFMHYDSGQTRYNMHYLNPRDSSAPRESVYDVGDSGAVIGENIAYDWYPRQITRYKQQKIGGVWTTLTGYDDSVVINDTIISHQPLADTNGRYRNYFIVTKGHLFSGGGADTSKQMLRIDVYYEVGHDEQYKDTAGSIVPHADTNKRFLYATVYVKEGQLRPASLSDPKWDEYREVALPVDLWRCAGCMSGPLDTLSESKQFDIRVTYLGGEKLAVHSITIRDSLAELMNGVLHNDSLYRDSIRHKLDTLMHKLSGWVFRSQITGVIAEDEPGLADLAPGYTGFNKLLHERFQNADGDSLPGFAAYGTPFLQHLSGYDYTMPETYTNRHGTFGYGPQVGVKYNQPPSLLQHNGGRFTIPLLFDLDSTMLLSYSTLQQRIEDYSEVMQRLTIGYAVDPYSFPPWQQYGFTEGPAWGHGICAREARKLGTPYMPIVGLHRRFIITNTGTVIAEHQQEPSEIRALVNLALCYGAHGIFYYGAGTSLNTLDSATHTMDDCCQGVYGEQAFDDSVDVKDLHFIELNYRRDLYDTTVQGVYVGWKSRVAELKRINRQWLPSIGPILKTLRWRDGYGIFLQKRRDSTGENYNDDRKFIPRPLPSTEIITRVQSRQLWDTTWEDSTKTYVELGLFDTKIDTTGGVRNRMKDKNFIWVLNRRTFEIPNDSLSNSIMDTSARGRAIRARLDSLTETRVIKLRLNLKHPDSVSQWNFVRVREIQPDTTSLPHMRKIARKGLDTCVYADSAITLMLGPGRAALLEIRYLDPAAPLHAGDLRFNNQRKLLWDGRRYHLVFHKDTLGDSRIYYRRSVYTHSHNANDSMTGGQIHWEPLEIMLSDTSVHGNVFPSLTLDTKEDDTVITVVWDRRKTSDSGNREIVLRKLRYNGAMNDTATDPIEHIAYHYGDDPTQWGTPVVSTLDFGEAIAWSDSVVGIKARLRTHGLWTEDPDWWRASPARYSSIATVESNVWTPWEIERCQYPSMPTFTHITARDSTCSIVWQQQHIWFDPAPFNTMHEQTDIHYARLRDSTGDSLVAVRNKKVISSSNTDNYHPSIDLVQDVWLGGYEGITWESVARTEQAGGDPPPDPTPDQAYINFASLYTPDSTWSPIGPWRSFLLLTQQWTSTMRAVGTIPHGTIPSYWPNTASLNYRYDSTSQNELVLFAVVYHDSTAGTMQQDLMHFALADSSAYIFWPNPNSYLFGGIYPTMSANRVIRAGWLPDSTDSTTTPPTTIHWHFRAEGWDRQPVRPAAIYIDDPGDSLLRTSKQFFAKSRPSGYMATGRAAIFRLNDSLATRISVGLHDVWYATDSSGHAAAMILRDSSLHRTDSLWQVQALLRTKNFHASDSVEIGCEVFGTFIGDSTSAGTAHLTCRAELVDSASGMVVAQLDSFVIASSSRWHHEVKAPIVDLLSGTYFVRLRIDTASLPAMPSLSYSNYPVTEVFSWVGEDHLGKLTKLDGATAARARMSAQPNPFSATTEIRFSIPKRDYATVRVYDKLGHEVATPLERRYMEAGRYALEFDGSALSAGAYLVELHLSDEDLVEKLVLIK